MNLKWCRRKLQSGQCVSIPSLSERFARRTGYRKITLWTNDILTAARRIYERAGYRLVRKEKHRSFGYDLVGETWEMKL